MGWRDSTALYIEAPLFNIHVQYIIQYGSPRKRVRYRGKVNIRILPAGRTPPSSINSISVNPPPLRGSVPRKSLISRIDWVSCAVDINLPHDLPPTTKSSTIKSWPTFCDQYFWKFSIWNSRADEKRREIRMVKVFKWYPVIDLFDTFTGKLGHGD